METLHEKAAKALDKFLRHKESIPSRRNHKWDLSALENINDYQGGKVMICTKCGLHKEVVNSQPMYYHHPDTIFHDRPECKHFENE